MKYDEFICKPKVQVEVVYLLLESAEKYTSETFDKTIYRTAMELLNAIKVKK